MSDKINCLEEFIKRETIEFLNNYKWIGNVRELINLVEYLVLIYDGDALGVDSLHHYMRDISLDQNRIILNRDEMWVLSKFYETGNSIGRIRLKEMAIYENINIGEGKIRRILEALKKYRLIETVQNQGCRINEKGQETVSRFKTTGWL